MRTGTTVESLMAQIRNSINEPRKHYELRQNKALFSQMASALDTIEDAELAIAAFATEEVSEGAGPLYLATYGLLQAIYVQQDAVTNLCESLGIQDTYSNYPALKDIRDIRNASIGHPTKSDRKKGQPTSYHQISQRSMSKNGFQMLSHDDTGAAQFRDISIPALVADQQKLIVLMLTK